MASVVHLSVLFLLLPVLQGSAQQVPPRYEVPLRRCDRLFLVDVGVGSKAYRFLVDSGATSMLDSESFTGGAEKAIEVSSWTGNLVTPSRAVTLREMAIGNAVLHNVTLPALDLRAIGQACGQRVDGIFGVDLMEKLGVTLDIERRVAILAAPAKGGADDLPSALNRCVDAFNHADARGFGACLDAQIAWLTPWGEFSGRDAILAYLQKRFFSSSPPANVAFRCRNYRPVGEAYLLEYEYTMRLPERSYRARGTALARKRGKAWQLVSMHNSTTEPVSEP